MSDCDTLAIVPLSDPTLFQISLWVILKTWWATCVRGPASPEVNGLTPEESVASWMALAIETDSQSSLGTLSKSALLKSRHMWHVCLSRKLNICCGSSFLRKQLCHQSVHVHGCLQSTDHIRFIVMELFKLSYPLWHAPVQKVRWGASLSDRK